MRWWIWIPAVIIGFFVALKLVAVLASLALNPLRRRIREAFAKAIQELRPNAAVIEINRKYLLIQTTTSLIRFELNGLYDAVMSDKLHAPERMNETIAKHLNGLLQIIDGNADPKEKGTETA